MNNSMLLDHATSQTRSGRNGLAGLPRFRRELRHSVWLFILLVAHGFQPVYANEPDRDGIARDLAYLMGYQAVGTGLIYYAPESVSSWSEEEKDELGFRQWRHNIGHPEWDEDHWAMNYVLHPYWGAAYYIRGRERGYSKAGSFWISTAFSTLYEFGFESFLEQPSWQDLIVTPLAGSLLGLYFEDVRRDIEHRDGPRTRMDAFILGATDPLGTLNGLVNSWLGIEESGRPQSVLGLRMLREPRGGAQNGPGRVAQRPGIDGFALTYSRRW